MRVLMVHDEPIDSGYGAESYVRRLVGGLREAGDEVEVVAGEVVHHGIGKVRDVWDSAARRLILARAQRFSPDVAHFHNVTRELSASVLAATPGVPAVMTVHDLRILGAVEHRATSLRGISERIGSTLVRRTALKQLRATMGVSERVCEELRRHGFPNVSLVPVPVVAPVTDGQPVAQCHDVAVIARLAPDKGVDLAIRAFDAAICERREERGRLLIAGDGPSREALERLAAGLGDRVSFLGRLDEREVSELLGRVRVVVVASQPSRRPEGSSLALVEAARHGRPVVASDDPALAELAAAMGNACVVRSGGMAAFAAELEQLLSDSDLATELGGRGRVNAERLHSVAAVTEATRAVYREVRSGADR